MTSYPSNVAYFLNWIAFILIIYAIFLTMTDNMSYNIVLIPIILSLLGIQLGFFIKSKKPQRKHAPIIYNIHTRDAEGQERYKQYDMKYKKHYQKNSFLYYSIFLIPLVFTALSLYSIFDFNIGICFFISAVISTICMVVLIKVFNIGIAESS